MSLHPRTNQVLLAQLDIQRAIITLAGQHGLTYVETVQGVARALEQISKHALRDERHPGNPDKGADEL